MEDPQLTSRANGGDGMKVLIPLDRSPRDAAIVAYVSGLAGPLEASLALLHVAHDLKSFLPGTLRKEEAYVEGVAQSLREEGLAAEAFFGKGDPVDLLLQLVADLPADIIAMATHGRRTVGKLVLGSVADRIVSLSPIPVLLLRVPVTEAETAQNGRGAVA
jgi:nucleotide-binding universal stress UspA family protein